MKDIDAFKCQYNQTFTLKNSKNYFSSGKRKNILYSNLDLNLNNNPRLKNNKFDEINNEIYLPIYKRYFTQIIKTIKKYPKKRKKQNIVQDIKY